MSNAMNTPNCEMLDIFAYIYQNYLYNLNDCIKLVCLNKSCYKRLLSIFLLKNFIFTIVYSAFPKQICCEESKHLPPRSLVCPNIASFCRLPHTVFETIGACIPFIRCNQYERPSLNAESMMIYYGECISRIENKQYDSLTILPELKAVYLSILKSRKKFMIIKSLYTFSSFSYNIACSLPFCPFCEGTHPINYYNNDNDSNYDILNRIEDDRNTLIMEMYDDGCHVTHITYYIDRVVDKNFRTISLSEEIKSISEIDKKDGNVCKKVLNTFVQIKKQGKETPPRWGDDEEWYYAY